MMAYGNLPTNSSSHSSPHNHANSDLMASANFFPNHFHAINHNNLHHIHQNNTNNNNAVVQHSNPSNNHSSGAGQQIMSNVTNSTNNSSVIRNNSSNPVTNDSVYSTTTLSTNNGQHQHHQQQPSSNNTFQGNLQPNLYSPSAIEYGITSSSPQSTAHSPDEYYEPSDQNYYHSSNEAGTPSNAVVLPETHIINTDNGLSYTNLDYMYGGNNPPSANFVDEKIAIGHYQLGDEMITPSNSNSTPAPWLAHHHHAHNNNLIHNHLHHLPARQFMDSSVPNHHLSHQLAQQSQIQASPATSMISHIMGGQTTGHHLPPNGQTANSQNSQQNITTFKWMQIKRNVPKPQGEIAITMYQSYKWTELWLI